MFTKSSIKHFALNSAGLVALADLSTIAQRSALRGSASFLDVLFLAPGIHSHQAAASNVNGGEVPTTGAMSSGNVFRMENQATVNYLRKIGQPGCLVNVHVMQYKTKSYILRGLEILLFTHDITASLLYLSGVAMTIVVLALLGTIHDFWALGVLGLLIFARFLNVVVIKRRTNTLGWKSVEEKDAGGDLLVLLSQDRWIRMRGLDDDLKAVTTGQWLRDETTIEGFATGLAKLLVYVAAAISTNSSTIGNLMIVSLLLISAALLGICNFLTQHLRMFDRIVYTTGDRKKYSRRSDLAEELIRSSGRDDWAIAMGLISSPSPHV